MSGNTSPQTPMQTPKSPKQSKLGSIGKKLIDGIRQMEIAADSWQAPGEINGLQGTYIRERPRFQNGQMSREAMMLEVERAKRLQELQKLQQEDDMWRKGQATRSPSERSSMSMQTHSRQHDDSARRLTQELADLELRKRALQEQQEQTEQQWREQTEHHDRQLQERMDALNRSPEMPPPPQDYGASPPGEEAYGQFFPRTSPQIPATGSRSPASPRGSGALPATPTPMGKVDELYSRMSNDELKHLAAVSNIPSFDKIPLATPAMKPHDPYQHGYQQQQNYEHGSMRPNYSQPPSGGTPGRPPWEKWEARHHPPYETMDDLRARSAPLYREQQKIGSMGRPSDRMRPRANSDSSQSDPFGLDASGPFGHQGYGGTSGFDNNPFEDYQSESLDNINPDDIFGTGHNSFDDEPWPPPNGPPGPPSRDPYGGGWHNGYASQGRSRTTSESSVPFGETPFPRQPQTPHDARRPRTNSMHPRRPPPQQQQQVWNGQGQYPPTGQPNQRMRSNSGPPRPNWGPGGGPTRDQDWQQRGQPPHPRDWNRQQQQFHPSQQGHWQDGGVRGEGAHRISRDDIAHARARAEQIRRQREGHEWKTRRHHQEAQEQVHAQRPQQHPPALDGLSDQDLSYLASDPIVRDLVLSRLPSAEQRSVMERLHRMGPVQVDDRQPGPPPQHQPYPAQSSGYHPPAGFGDPRMNVQPEPNTAAFPSMSPKQQAAPGVRFEDDEARTPMASPRMPNTPFSAQTPLGLHDMPSHYPGRPPTFPAEPTRSAEFRVHRRGASLDGFEGLQVIQHLTSYPPASTGPVPSDQNELVTSQILDLVSRAKKLGAKALIQLQTRELPSGQYIVEGDAAQ